MGNVTQDFKEYLEKTLGLKARIGSTVAFPKDKIAFFLRDVYHLYGAKIQNQVYVLVVPRGKDMPTPGTLQKHLQQIQEATNLNCIFVAAAITSFNRSRLIDRKIPFVVPNNQMYLPMIGIDLREHFIGMASESECFSPATQALVIHLLTRPGADRITPSEAAKLLGYSPMTMTRAFNELEALKVGRVELRGRERIFHHPGKTKDLWEQSRPFMRSPVRKKIWVHGLKSLKAEKGLLHSGLWALSLHSSLGSPPLPCFALNEEQWAHLRSKVRELPSQEEADAELELWVYKPELLSTGRTVDCFSLKLSLDYIQDERVELALDEMMDQLKVSWEFRQQP